MRIGVLGLGFIGMPLAKSLHDKGHEVFSWTRTQKNTIWENYIEPNVLTEKTLDTLVIASGAARPGIGDISFEFETTLHLVRNMNLNNLVHLYYISSGAVYGECRKPMSEIELAIPSTEYGRAKLSTELALKNQFKDRFTSLRVGNVVNWDSPYGLFSEIANVSNGKLTLDFFGDVSSARDYLEINSFVDIVSNLISSQAHQPIINIASGDSLTLGQIIESINKVARRRLEIKWHLGRSQDVQVTQLDVGLLRSISEVTSLAFKPQFESFLRDVLTDLTSL